MEFGGDCYSQCFATCPGMGRSSYTDTYWSIQAGGFYHHINFLFQKWISPFEENRISLFKNEFSFLKNGFPFAKMGFPFSKMDFPLQKWISLFKNRFSFFKNGFPFSKSDFPFQKWISPFQKWISDFLNRPIKPRLTVVITVKSHRSKNCP